eukprot:scaffold215519_cov50-Cyclotella_meneghiniana.AAC.1
MALTPPNNNTGDTTRFKRFGGRALHSHESSLRIFRVDSALETRLRNTYTPQFLCDLMGYCADFGAFSALPISNQADPGRNLAAIVTFSCIVLMHIY